MRLSRRDFLKTSAKASAAIPVLGSLETFAFTAPRSSSTDTINVFSKHLQWLSYHDMAAAAAEIGFDGIDLTVRPDGHVLPERAVDDLPKAVDAIRKAGLHVSTLTTAIKSVDEPHTESILKTANSLGVNHYRMGWLEYDGSKTIEENISQIKVTMTRLAELNAKYNMTGDYQNHSGTGFGASVWDLWMVLKEINSPMLGVQYDILHAMVEGANSWPLGFKLVQPHIHSLDIKDFIWEKKGAKWSMEVVPVGSGMVDYNKYLPMLKSADIRAPFSMHFEYPLGGAEHGARKISLSRGEVLSAMKRDLTRFKEMLKNVQW